MISLKNDKPTSLRKNELWAARGAAAVIIAGYFGINPPGFVAGRRTCFGLAAASLFPAIILDFFEKNKEGAIAGMIIGLLLMLFYMLKFKFGLLMVERCCCWLKRAGGSISPEGLEL
jgi:cation/acetate symporter